jgi:hypothetical protein
MGTNQFHIHLQRVQPMAGFAAANIPPKSFGWILSRAFVCSDDPKFYLYCDQISKMFLNRYIVDAISHFLVVIHIDLSADVYINDFQIQIKVLAKRDVKAGEPLLHSDIADIAEIRFPGIDIKESDSVIFCFKKGWKFGLFFDFSPADRISTLNVELLSHDLGSYYRYLTFQELYSILENNPLFETMFSDGWFPFIQLLGGDFEEIAKYYKHDVNLFSDLSIFLSRFDRKRIYSFAERWWKNPLFEDKRKILEAGIEAYLSATDAGYINCVKTLYSEIEGIIRIRYIEEKGNNPTFMELVDFIKQKAEGKFGPQKSLGFQDVFYRYMKETIFQKFNLTTGQVELSRHSVSHGVAEQTRYTRTKAIQAILTIDQMYFYLT